MALVNVGVTIIWAQGGIPAVNTGEIEFDDAAQSYQQAATNFMDAARDRLLRGLSNDTQLQRVQIGDDNNGGSDSNGGVGQVQLPSTSVLASYNIVKQINGARNGRWFMPGVAEAVVDAAGGVLQSTVTDLNNDLSLFLADLAADGISIGVTGKDLVYRNVQTMTVKNFISYQSRRLDRARGY